MKMNYSIMPSRAVSDKRLSPNVVRTLSALCCFTSVNGICYPNQSTLGNLIGVSRQLITRNIGTLRTLGYIIDMEPLGAKHPLAYQRGNRYFIPVKFHDPIPAWETQRFDVLSVNRRSYYVALNDGGLKGGMNA